MTFTVRVCAYAQVATESAVSRLIADGCHIKRLGMACNIRLLYVIFGVCWGKAVL